MNFGIVDQYILFGGGPLLCLTAGKLKQDSFSVFVVTSERHSVEQITINGNSNKLIQTLKNDDIDFDISKNPSQDSRILNRITENTIGISFGAAWIFKKQFINRFNGRLLNCHGSRLPQDRGGGGFSWRILRDDRTGVSLIHQIVPEVDAGNIILFNEYIFPNSCRYPIDYQTHSTTQYQALLNTFFALVKNEKSFELIAQQEYLSSYWPRLTTDVHGYVDWNWTLKEIERFICAFDDPYDGASTFLNDKKVRLMKCHSSINDGVFHPFQKGLIYRITGGNICVATEEGTLLINEVLDEDGVDMKQRIRVGDRLYTPMKYLEEAKQFRAMYTPKGLKEKRIDS